jgi:phosphate:Na+ symporter
MQLVGHLILGLGLFFLGMQLVGENLRRLSGPTFRKLMARSTGSGWEAGIAGVVFGALMQSATAVTFILVSMVTSGLIAARAALPVIAWTNVGLTSLAFVVTLNIHPFVAFAVGAAAVAVAMLRAPKAKAVAGVVLGIALIFFGLQTMGDAAHPLVHAPWFQKLLDATVDSPAIAFLIGIALAAILQSNTASALLVITLAGAGAFDLDSALMLIYGTNLGAILLRLLLAADLRGTPLQLVRFEDLFCLTSGVIMVTLFYVEELFGVPLVQAAVSKIGDDVRTQLAFGFLLSNLIPAMVLSPFFTPCLRLLTWCWPPTTDENAAKPKYLTSQSIDDPSTALDVLERELARLITHVARLLDDSLPTSGRNGSDETRHFESIGQLVSAIDTFAIELATKSLAAEEAGRLNLLREELAFAGYLKDRTHEFATTLRPLLAVPAVEPFASRMLTTAQQLLNTAATVAKSHDAAALASLRESTRTRGETIAQVQQSLLQEAQSLPPASRTALMQLVEDLQMIAWLLHRLTKVLESLAGRPE